MAEPSSSFVDQLLEASSLAQSRFALAPAPERQLLVQELITHLRDHRVRNPLASLRAIDVFVGHHPQEGLKLLHTLPQSLDSRQWRVLCHHGQKKAHALAVGWMKIAVDHDDSALLSTWVTLLDPHARDRPNLHIELSRLPLFVGRKVPPSPDMRATLEELFPSFWCTHANSLVRHLGWICDALDDLLVCQKKLSTIDSNPLAREAALQSLHHLISTTWPSAGGQVGAPAADFLCAKLVELDQEFQLFAPWDEHTNTRVQQHLDFCAQRPPIKTVVDNLHLWMVSHLQALQLHNAIHADGIQPAPSMLKRL